MQEMQETQIQSLGQEDPLDLVLAWEIPGTEELLSTYVTYL